MGIIKLIRNKVIRYLKNKGYVRLNSNPDYKFLNESWSQEGEDLIIHRFFERKNDGFYIDIGAHHPFRFSNTYKLFKKGWRGLNIDADDSAIDLFNQFRPNDINIYIGVAANKGELDFYKFHEIALNTFDKERSEELQESGWELLQMVN
jgi:hypothetical protein